MFDEIINFETKMDYEKLNEAMKMFDGMCKFAQVYSIGKTTLGKEIWCVKLGHGEKKAIYVGAHHAMEWIGAQLLVKFIHDVIKNMGMKFKGYDLSALLAKYTIYIVPMLNADGVDININGADENSEYYQQMIFQNNGSRDFSRWQANIRGVDLNHNYDAGWVENKELEQKHGIYSGAATRYGGAYPESEAETIALCNLTREINPDVVLALHSQGQEIYYNFLNKAPRRALDIGYIMANMTGYKLQTIDGIASYGGYKDWFIDEFMKPGFTVELGEGVNPLPLTFFSKIYSQIVEMLLILPIL